MLCGLVALSGNLGQQRFLALDLVIPKPVEDIALGFLAEGLVFLGNAGSQFVSHKIALCVVFESLHTEGMVLALQNLEQLLARGVARADQLVVSLSVWTCTLLSDVGHIIFFGEQAQFVLEELLGILVALCGDGFLQSFANGRSPSVVGAGKGNGTVDGIFHFGVDALCSRLEHGGKHGDGLWRSLHERLHLVVEVGLFLYGHEGEHILDDGLGRAIARILCKRRQAQKHRCYNNI